MLNPVACQQLISTQGERIRWLEALPCDCRDPGDPDYGDHRGCAKCQYGYVYRERVLGPDVRAMVTQVRREFIHRELGFLQVGELLITTMAEEVPLGNWDRVVLVERAMPKKEIVHFGDDELAEDFPTAVLSVADADTEFVQAHDYRFDDVGGKIVWLGQRTPAGSIYTVHYYYAPVYWYVGAPMQTARPIRGRAMRMPQSGKLEIKHPVEG